MSDADPVTDPVQQAEPRPDLVHRSPEGRLVLAWNAPAWATEADRFPDLVAWAARTSRQGADLVLSGGDDTPVAPVAPRDAVDIAFISPEEPDQADALTAALTEQLAEALPGRDVRAVWLVHDPDPSSRLQRANDDLATLVSPLAAPGRGILLWATVVGDHRAIGLHDYDPDHQSSTPFTGQQPASLERAVLAHKRAFAQATGRPWVSLRALYQPGDLPPLVQTDTDAPLPWTPVPDDAWAVEQQRWPA